MRHAYRVSIASRPDERADAIDVYLRSSGEGTLALALTGPGEAGNSLVQRATSGALRGGLTAWVHVGMLVRRMRGRADPLQGLGHRDTFLALCRLAQAAVEGVPVETGPAGGVHQGAHVRLFTTPYPAQAALPRLQQVLQPYAAAGTTTATGRAVIAWFAIRHLIAVRAEAYSLQVVHLTPENGGPCQVSLMLPRVAEDARAGPGAGRAPGPRRLRRRAQRAAEAAALAATAPPAPGAGPTLGPAPVPGSGPAASSSADALTLPRGLPLVAATTGPLQVQAYLDAYREHLTRELLLEPVVDAGPVAGFAWTPEPTGDGGGVAVAGTVPGAVSGEVVLRMAAQAVAQLGERSREFAGVPWGTPEPDGDLLVQRWIVGAAGAHVLSVAARSGDRRRPTQVLIHLAPREPLRAEPAVPGEAPRELELPYEVPRTGPAVDEARALILLPLWWHSANARCDGNDVILYEMPFRGNKLRIRANDYPAEPMYTLLVGDVGREIAAVDLEDWPPSWTRPRST